jgi:hypothetical protein
MKRPTRIEEQHNPMRDLDIELESQDDDIIELEDIIEMPSRPIDEYEDLDLDVEILDVDSYLEQEPEMPAKKAAQPFMREQAQKHPPKQEDMFEAFDDEAEEDEMLFEPVASGGPAKKTGLRAETKVFDEEKEPVLDDFMDELGMTEPGTEKRADLRRKTVETIMDAEEILAPAGVESELISDESLESELISVESLESTLSQPAAPRPTPIPSPADISQIADELIGRLESRLQEHIRITVESSLPDLVRSIISEELEKLKKGLD